MKKMTYNSNLTTHTDLFLRSRLSAALRTGWACLLAALLVEFGNMHVQWMSFPILSYIMAVNIVGESTLGRAIQDATDVLLGIIQGVGMAMINLQLIHPERMSLWVAILCVALSTFIITYPKSTHIMTKRVAMAETAIIYITAHIQREKMNDVYFPLKVAATVTVGATCATIALLLPLPGFAFSKVNSQAKLAVGITYERFRVLVDVFCANSETRALSLNLQAKSLGEIGATALAEANAKKDDIHWEIPGCYEHTSHIKHLVKGLNGLKKHLMGMEIALQADIISHSKKKLLMMKSSLIYLTDWASLALTHASMDSAVSSVIGQNHIQGLIDAGNRGLIAFDEELASAIEEFMSCKGRDSENMKESKRFLLEYISSDMESTDDESKPSFQTQTAAFFFLSLLRKFVIEIQNIISSIDQKQTDIEIMILKSSGLQEHDEITKTCCSSRASLDAVQQQHSSAKVQQTSWTYPKFFTSFKPNFEQFRTSFKMGVCMGLATFLGSWYNESHGYWADIAVALGFGNVAGGSLKMANLRAQGTVAGSMYGLLAAIVTRNYPYLRIVALIPWVVFTAFLRKSKTFEYTGALSAFTGAIVILGRRHKESDEDFTIVRLVEAFLGMTSFIIVELIIFPRRASYSARTELIAGMGSLREFLAAFFSAHSGNQCLNCFSKSIKELKEKEKNMRALVSKQTALVKEASDEPELWFAPFPGNIYSKLVDSQGRILDLVQFTLYSIDDLVKISWNKHIPIEKLHAPLKASFEIVEEKVGLSLEFLKKVLEITSFGDQTRQKIHDQADEDSQISKKCKPNSANLGEVESHAEGIVPSRSIRFIKTFEMGFQDIAADLMKASPETEDSYIEKHVSNTLILSLSSVAFSMQGLLKETTELEKKVHELLQVENPWSLIDFWDASKSMGQMWSM